MLDENSIDTAGSAENAPPIIQEGKFEHAALLSVGYHVPNAATLFERYGVPFESVIVAEDILEERSDGLYEDYVVAWRGLDRVAKENKD